MFYIIQWPPCTKRPNYLLIYWRRERGGNTGCRQTLRTMRRKNSNFHQTISNSQPTNGGSSARRPFHFSSDFALWREPDDRPMLGARVTLNVQPSPRMCNHHPLGVPIDWRDCQMQWQRRIRWLVVCHSSWIIVPSLRTSNDHLDSTLISWRCVRSRFPAQLPWNILFLFLCVCVCVCVCTRHTYT